MVESLSSADQAAGWQDRAEKARALAHEISVLAGRARAGGFHTTEYTLSLAASDLWKDIDPANKDAKK
jgi:hypothetical protein